jgi:hypothetical protein
MNKTAYDIATEKLKVDDEGVLIGNKRISLERGRDILEDFLGRRPYSLGDVAEDFNSAKIYFGRILEDYHKKKN